MEKEEITSAHKPKWKCEKDADIKVLQIQQKQMTEQMEKITECVNDVKKIVTSRPDWATSIIIALLASTTTGLIVGVVASYIAG